MNRSPENLKDLFARILDNQAPIKNYKQLGLLRFAKEFYPTRFDSDFATLHYDMAMLFFQLLSPERKFMVDRQAYMLVHREASKSTFGSFLLPSYLIYLKGYNMTCRVMKPGWEGGDGVNNFDILQIPIKENFILMASETATRAEGFVSSLRSEIEIRSDMAKIFGEKDPNILEIDDERERAKSNKWTMRAFVTKGSNGVPGTIVYGIGSGQQTRGTNIEGHRPDLIIVDDMYSQKNTKTEQSREQLNYWFTSELMNSGDSVKGKALWLGTMVHVDTVTKDFDDAEDWFGIRRPLISLKELKTAIKFCNDYGNGQFKIPPIEVMDKEQLAYKTLSWGSRHTLYSIMKRYRKHVVKGNLNYFYQEFMNMIVAPETQDIKQESFNQCGPKFWKEEGVQWVEFHHEGIRWRGEIYLQLGIDLGSSLNAKADLTVLCLFGYARCYPYIQGIDWQTTEGRLKQGKIFPCIAHIESGNYDIEEYEGRKGVVESILSLDRLYIIKKIRIDAQGQQQMIIRGIRKELRLQKVYKPVDDVYSNINKEERILSTIKPLVQKYKTIMCLVSELIDKIYFQVITISAKVNDHDDEADALQMAIDEAKEPPFNPKISGIARDEYEVEVKNERPIDFAKKKAWWFY